jgi:hypothetical protein
LDNIKDQRINDKYRNNSFRSVINENKPIKPKKEEIADGMENQNCKRSDL